MFKIISSMFHLHTHGIFLKHPAKILNKQLKLPSKRYNSETSFFQKCYFQDTTFSRLQPIRNKAIVQKTLCKFIIFDLITYGFTWENVPKLILFYASGT